MAKRRTRRGRRLLVRLLVFAVVVLAGLAGWAALTWQLERHLSKKRILELYLNIAQLGPGIYGVEAAARRYFGVSAAELDAAQAAALAAALPRPSSWHPGVEARGYRRAIDRIRQRVEQAYWLDTLL